MRTTKLTAAAALVLTAFGAQAMSVTPTNDGTALLNAFVSNPGDFASISVAHTVGAATQVGTYTGFSLLPVTIGDGIVLSSGLVAETAAPALGPSTSIGASDSTPEIDGYAQFNITNWGVSRDTSQVTVSFTLAAPSAVAFDFVFGSTEYPVYVDNYTDAMFAFLDGTQITFDSNNDPVQVGSSFAGLLTTADNNSAFRDPHGLVGVLTTVSGMLDAGSHTLNIAVADTNDRILDSAAFLANFRLAENTGGPITTPTGVPEPATMAILGIGLAALGLARRRRA